MDGKGAVVASVVVAVTLTLVSSAAGHGHAPPYHDHAIVAPWATHGGVWVRAMRHVRSAKAH